MADDFEDNLSSVLNRILEPAVSIDALIKRESMIGELRAYRKVFGFPVEQVDIETERFAGLSGQLEELLGANTPVN